MTNEKQLENQEKVKMPWQGKTWIGINIVGFTLVWIFVAITMFLSNTIGFFDLEIDLEFFIVIFLLSLVFVSLVSIGFARGWRWMINVILILSMLGVLRDFIGISLFVFNGGDTIDFVIDLIFLPYSIFMTYLVWFCSKHPYYNQKKLKNNSVKINQ